VVELFALRLPPERADIHRGGSMRIARFVACSAMAIAGLSAPPRGETQPAGSVVVRPFDVASAPGVGGVGSDLGQTLARLVADEIEKRGLAADRHLVVRGTLVNAGFSRAGGRVAGGSIGRQTAEVVLAIRLVDPQTGEILTAFEATGEASETGANVDFVSALVSVERRDDDWRRSPMGLAIHRAALEVAEQTALWDQREAE
jgi:hypothetical protein